MDSIQYSTHQHNFVTVESRLCRKVINLPEKEAVLLVEKNGRVAFISKRDKAIFEHAAPSWHSYRINLVIKNGRVINTSIG
jgi:hypothetical protein